MRIFRLVSVIIFSFTCVFADINTCSFDIHFSPYSGAENLLTLQRRIEKIEDAVFPTSPITLSNVLNGDLCDAFSTKNSFGRLFRTFAIWIPVNASVFVTQHEIFGHGFRIRDLGSEYAAVTGYKMYLITGSTNYEITKNLTTSQKLAIDIGGIEADSILRDRMRLGWVRNQRVDARQYLLYFLSSLSLTNYAWSSDSSKDAANSNHDITSFLFYLKSMYRDTNLNRSHLRTLSLVNVLDPFLFYSFLAAINYQKWTISYPVPMFHIGSVKYLPAVKVGLTPFGVQGFWENFFQLGDAAPTYAYLKWGKNGANTYYGIGVQNQAVFAWKTGSLGFRADVWHQPDVLFDQGLLSVQEIMDLPDGSEIPQLYPDEVLRKKHFGAAVSAIGMYGGEKWPAKIFAELGYKTAGYLPGEALRAAPIVRGGFSAAF